MFFCGFLSYVECVQPTTWMCPTCFPFNRQTFITQGAFDFSTASKKTLVLIMPSLYNISASIIASTTSKVFSYRKYPFALAILKKTNTDLLGPPPKFQVKIKI